MRSHARLLLLALAATAFPATLPAQAGGGEAAARSALEALTAGDVDAYIAHFAPDAHVVLELDDSEPLELDVAQWRRVVSEARWLPEEVSSRVFGTTAVTVARLSGSLLMAGFEIEGPWRYAETRVRGVGGWKVVQLEVSPMGPGGGGAGGAAAAEPPEREPRAGSAAPVEVAARAARLTRPVAGRPETEGAEGGTLAGDVSPLVAPAGVPAAPVPPEVITRDDAGNATVRAIRLGAPLDVDGRLDEPVYRDVRPLDGFIQSLPDEGAPATELTEAWILFDDENVYVSARVHEEVPESEWVANEMRRDANQVGNNDNFGLVFDTYYDRRNGYFFYTNPLGAMVDVQVTNEGSPNFDWNPVWNVRTGRFEGGWTVEAMIPFKSLRYRPGTEQVWGLQLRRGIRRKNEWSHLTLVSRAAAGASGRNGIIRMSRAATLVGLEAPPAGMNIDVKPYGIASLTTDRTATPQVNDDLDGDGGLDLKWGVTQNLALDFTVNTDFAQVEVDEQQVNLTRYSLVFPEKREFFLESRGIFDFPAGTAAGGGGQGAPNVFFSRRIGLQSGRRVPILGGGRLTGKLGPFDVGALDIQTDEESAAGADPTNFTVVRVRADVLSRSNVGLLFTRRSRSLEADGWNHAYGADASFSFFQNLYLTGFYALTHTPDLPLPEERLAQSWQARASWDGDLQGISASHLLVEDDFNPEVGLVRRSGFRQSQLSARLSPRPASIEWIRQITLQGNVDYLENARLGYVETREISGSFAIELENSDQLRFAYTNSYENLLAGETITGATIPAGRYDFDAVDASYSFGTQRFFSGNLSVRHGGFYDGELTSAGLSRGRIEVLRQLSLEPSVSFNWVRLPGAAFETTLVATRVSYTFSPRMFFSGLVQYNSSSDSFGANLRLRWEYAPGSEIFLVYTEERDTFDFERFPVLANRGLVLKVNRLLRL